MTMYKTKLVFVAIAIKACLSILLLFFKGFPEASLREIACTGDCQIAYVPATENIIRYGSYSIYEDLSPYTGRMPGYELILAFSTVFSSSGEISFLFVLIFQIILAGISAYYLAALSYLFFNNERVFVLTFIAYLISTYNSLFDIAVLSESIAISIFIISFY